ncbi:integral membrane protein [Cordyceps fumosorosea ARSEF 2679]|uniref:Integral membrane protein n=1 Tax=Cordyceps fumosorosea (strain ARSEF 2679) TaxID=1081104 RepID=A0A167Q1Y5_CORFA|nr:integral membrane protein [Cordyceps fumosorosea ARSEF 2679]OAA57212.1 integral membrane protein [Cordyceps fumosorosea ARSEF 2679]
MTSESFPDYTRLLATAGLTITHYIVGSVLFDLVHWQAHQKSRSPLVRWLSRTHAAHHQYFDRRLRFQPRFRAANLASHMPLEFACQALGSTASWLLLRRLYPAAAAYDLLIVMVVQVIRTSVVAWNMGHDSNHIPYEVVPKDRNHMIVGPEYHVLHHIDPQNYFGSMVRVVDVLFGTATTLRGRRVAMTGSQGALGKALTEVLRKQERVASVTPLRHGIEWTPDDLGKLAPLLAETDVLVLCHGTKDAASAHAVNCAATVAIVELFRRVRTRAGAELIPEVWYVGSEAELHGAMPGDGEAMKAYAASKRAFVPFARAYYDDEDFLYRHVVPAAFQSKMGSAVVGADWAARVAVWWIRRGAQYVPVTYTGLAFVNYFRFMYWVAATPAGSPKTHKLTQ